MSQAWWYILSNSAFWRDGGRKVRSSRLALATWKTGLMRPALLSQKKKSSCYFNPESSPRQAPHSLLQKVKSSWGRQELLNTDSVQLKGWLQRSRFLRGSGWERGAYGFPLPTVEELFLQTSRKWPGCSTADLSSLEFTICKAFQK